MLLHSLAARGSSRCEETTFSCLPKATTGLISSTSLGSVSTTPNYNAFGEVETETATFGANALYSYALTRDAIGRINGKTETVGGVTTSYAYTFDPAGRLTDVTKNGVAQSHYDYDSNSNRTGGHRNGVSFSATYDVQDRLLTYGTKSYTYNLNGDLTSKTDSATSTTTNYTYDVFGGLTQVQLPTKTINYVIDGSGRRIIRKIGTAIDKYYLYFGKRILAEVNPNGTMSRRYVYATKSHVPDYVIQGSSVFKVVTDHLGSVRMVVNIATGTIAQQIEYDEYGRVLSDTNPGFQAFGFAGGLYDHETKLVRFGARDYDAEVGRWTSKDPILFAGGDTNLYGYVLQDPINFIDPDGKMSIAVGIIITVTVGPLSYWVWDNYFREEDALDELKRQIDQDRMRSKGGQCSPNAPPAPPRRPPPNTGPPHIPT